MSYHVTPDDARHVLWAVGDERGYEPGGFVSKLLEAAARADLVNRGRLYLAFPGLMQAVMLADTEAGREELVRIAEGRS